MRYLFLCYTSNVKKNIIMRIYRDLDEFNHIYRNINTIEQYEAYTHF